MKRDNITLKTFFETGDYPTQTQFADLIDSFLNIQEKDAVTGITNNGDGTYTFQLLSGGTVILDVQSLPNDIPIASIAGLQVALDALQQDIDNKTHTNIESKGVGDVKTGRNIWDDGVHTYSTHASNINKPSGLNYGASIVWGRGAEGSAELMIGWTSGDQNQIYFRSLRNVTDSWWSWKKIWHSGNDGSGSGLDADRLDGIESSGFLRSDTNDFFNGQVLTMGYGNSSRIDFLNVTNPDQSVSLEYEATDGNLKEGGYAVKIKSQNTIPQDKAHLEVEGGVYANHFSIDDSNCRFTKVFGDAVRLTNPTGYLEIGPKNTSHCHFYTDRSNFFFNKELRIDTGIVSSYNEDLFLTRTGSTQARIRVTASSCVSDQNFLIYGRSGEALTIRASSNNANTPCIARFEQQDGIDRGYVGYGSSSNSHLYLLNNEGTSCYLMLKTNGEAEFNNNVRADNFILSSDRRLKEKIKPLEKSIDVDFVEFELKKSKGEKRYGVIAQDVENKHPELVFTDDEGMKQVKYIDLLVAKIAELEKRVVTLEKK